MADLTQIQAALEVAGSDGTTQQTIKTDTSGNQTAVGNIASGVADSGNPVKTGGVYNSTLPSPASGSRVDTQMDLNGRQLVATSPLDGYKASYSAAITGLAAAATPTDVFTLTGSATKIIRVTRMGISGTQTTSAVRDVQVIKRSTANTGGTSSAITAIKHDSNDAATTGTVLAYTANPTLGTTVGVIRTIKMDVEATNLVGASDHFELTFGNGPSKGLVLRGTSEVLAINLNAVTSNGNSWNFYIEWTEE